VTESIAAPPQLMKAIVYRHYGSPDVLQLEDYEMPTTRENETGRGTRQRKSRDYVGNVTSAAVCSEGQGDFPTFSFEAYP